MTDTPRFSYRNVRWWVVGLLFFATVINYVDRQTLSILGTTLRTELNLTEQDYANCVSAFLVSYAVMYSVSGRVIDRVGVKVGAAACVVWWSIANMLTAAAHGMRSLGSFRFLLGLGEARSAVGGDGQAAGHRSLRLAAAPPMRDISPIRIATNWP